MWAAWIAMQHHKACDFSRGLFTLTSDLELKNAVKPFIARCHQRDTKMRTRRMPHCLPASRPMNRSKKLAESTSTATFALGTNLSRRTGDVLVLARVGADPRIGMFRATCFSISGRRRKSPAVG